MSRFTLKFRKIDIAAVLCFAGIFIFNSTLVSSFYPLTVFKRWSIIFVIGIFLIYIFARNESRDISTMHWETPLFYLIILFEIIFFVVQLFNNSFSSTISFAISNILFMFIISYRICSKDNMLRILRIWMWFLRMCTYIIVAMFIVDLFSNYALTGLVANLSGTDSLLRMYNRHRVVSYMGHPLFTTEILITYYLFSHLYNEIQNKRNNIIPFLLALFGIIMTQSRIGLVILIVAFFLLNFNFRQIWYILLAFIILSIIFLAGGFDNILSRFTSTGWFTNDVRTTSLTTLISTDQLHFYWFKGQDATILSTQGNVSAALEFILFRLAYVYGIFFAVVIAIVAFIFPLIVVIRRKQKTLIIALAAIILDVNTYSGFSDIGMNAIFYFVVVCLILNISNYLESCKCKLKIGIKHGPAEIENCDSITNLNEEVNGDTASISKSTFNNKLL